MEEEQSAVDSQPCFLVTGATGFIGAFLVDALLRQGREVICLARSPSGRREEARQRVVRVLRRIAPDQSCQGLHVEAGDITEPLGGLSDSFRRTWRGRVQAIWHCAAETRFSVSREEAFRTNVVGTEGILDAGEDLCVPNFHLISTAYLFEPGVERAEERPIPRSRGFRNVYEESKAEAESRLLSRVQRTGMVGSIFRLPVTMGHSRTGCTTQFLGYYSLAKVFFDMRRSFGRLIANNLGVLLRVLIVPRATINILPVDVVMETLLRCLSKPIEATTIFNITNGTPPTVRFLYEETLRYSGMTIIEVKEADHPDIVSVQTAPGVSRTESRLRRSMRHYIPYLKGEPTFSRANLARYIGPAALPNFEFKRDYLEKALTYAVDHNWR